MGRPSSLNPKGETPPVTEIDQVTDAQDAATQEHELGFFEALKFYPNSIFWSIAMSTVVVMEGYDTKLIGTLFAQPAFQKAYGHEVKPGSYQISAPWQTGLSDGSAIGQLLGLVISGYVSERFGFRKTTCGGLFVIAAFIFISFFAPNLIVLEVGQILFGIPLGVFQTIPVIYALELAPLCLRAYLTNYVNFCWAFGQILATGVLRATLHMESQWAYRIPFAVQWVWPVILLPLLYFAPESPWWLVRVGQVQEARDTVQRLVSPKHTHFDIDKHITLMVVTTEQERRVNAETSYLACFQGTNLRRTLIAFGIYSIQTLNGNPLRGYSTYFLEQAGMATTQAFNMSIVGFALAIAGGFFSWALLPLFGRRTIYFWSLVVMFVIMMLIGGLGVPQAQSPNASYAWAIGSILIISSFVYYGSIGPLTNTLCSEIPTALLRTKTVTLARYVYTITSIVAGVLTPYQLNPTAWNWSAKTGFFWAGGCLISIIFTYFYVPEPKDRTTAEIDVLFERKIPARHFSKTPVKLTEALHGDSEEKSV